LNVQTSNIFLKTEVFGVLEEVPKCASACKIYFSYPIPNCNWNN